MSRTSRVAAKKAAESRKTTTVETVVPKTDPVDTETTPKTDPEGTPDATVTALKAIATALKEHKERIDNLEKRVSALETSGVDSSCCASIEFDPVPGWGSDYSGLIKVPIAYLSDGTKVGFKSSYANHFAEFYSDKKVMHSVAKVDGGKFDKYLSAEEAAAAGC